VSFRDEWVIGGNLTMRWRKWSASDPISVWLPWLEEARSIAELSKTGWKPKRTIIYCAWDAEEPSPLG